MTKMVTEFAQITSFMDIVSAPTSKKRSLLREFLQSKFISILYEQPKATKLAFVGGTSLRLLFDIPRFSEDLDFDNLGLTNEEIFLLIEAVVTRFENENIEVELKKSIKDHKTYFELRFSRILFDLQITTNHREKLMIKVDYSTFWKAQNTQTILFNKYGFIANVVTNQLDQILVQKLTAYVNRKQTQARDIYDIVWLYSQGARVDKTFMQKNDVSDVLKKSKDKFVQEGITSTLKNRLEPFLFQPHELKKLDLFEAVLNGLF